MPLSDEQVVARLQILLADAQADPEWVSIDPATQEEIAALTQAIERFTACGCRRVYWAISMAPSVYPDHYRYSDGVDREIPYPDDAPFCMFCGRPLAKPKEVTGDAAE